MVHTVQISRRLTRDKFSRIARNYFREDEIQAFLEGRTTGILEVAYPDYPGINSISFLHGGEEYLSLSLVINPRTLVTGAYTLDLFQCTDDLLQLLDERFTAALRDLGLTSFPSIRAWYPRRIDFAVDILTPDVALYVALGKRERRPRGFVDLVDYEGSAYPQSRYVTLNVYDKRDQVEKELQHLREYEQLLAEAENTFRVEVQCNREKLKALAKKYRLPNRHLGHFLDERIARETILYYYGLMFGYQDFYSLPEAYRIVDRQRWRSDHKERFKAWLRSIVDAGSFTAAKEAFARSSTTLDNYMKDCREIGVNPITMPAEWGRSHLPNPMPLDYRPN